MQFSQSKLTDDLCSFSGSSSELNQYLDTAICEVENHGINGFLDTDILLSFINASSPLHDDKFTHIYNVELFKVLKNRLISVERYSSIFINIIKEPSQQEHSLRKDNIREYFQHISVDEWLIEWRERCVETFVNLGHIKDPQRFDHSLSYYSDLGAYLASISNAEFTQYIYKNASQKNLLMVAREILKYLIVSNYKNQPHNTLLNLIQTAPEIISDLNKEVDIFVNSSDMVINKPVFSDRDFRRNIAALNRCKRLDETSPLIYCIRVANGTKGDIVRHLNSSKSFCRSGIVLLLSILNLDPYDILQDPHLSSNGKVNALTLLTE
jgi:hypothetical protein